MGCKKSKHSKKYKKRGYKKPVNENVGRMDQALGSNFGYQAKNTAKGMLQRELEEDPDGFLRRNPRIREMIGVGNTKGIQAKDKLQGLSNILHSLPDSQNIETDLEKAVQQRVVQTKKAANLMTGREKPKQPTGAFAKMKQKLFGEMVDATMEGDFVDFKEAFNQAMLLYIKEEFERDYTDDFGGVDYFKGGKIVDPEGKTAEIIDKRFDKDLEKNIYLIRYDDGTEDEVSYGFFEKGGWENMKNDPESQYNWMPDDFYKDEKRRMDIDDSHYE